MVTSDTIVQYQPEELQKPRQPNKIIRAKDLQQQNETKRRIKQITQEGNENPAMTPASENNQTHPFGEGVGHF